MIEVEDGTGKDTAESYASVADADLYLSSRGVTAWASLTDVDKEGALRRSTDYMLAEYRPKWSGKRVSATQALDWPRKNVTLEDSGDYPTDSVPKEVVRACIELAYRAASGDLLDDEESKVLEEAIGPIIYKYDQGVSSRKKYPQVDNLLRPYLSGPTDSDGVFMAKLVRC